MKHHTAAIEAFTEVVGSVGGTLKEKLVAGKGVYCRAILPEEKCVQPKDALKPGVALRANLRTLQVVPYVFRILCSNGALWTQSATAFSMETDEGTTARDIEEFVRDSTVTAASAESFQSCLQEIRAGRNTPADHLLSIVASVRSAARELDRMLLDLVLAAIARSEEPETRYDAMNVVTAAARDVPDPELKWKLEALATRLLIRSVRDARERTGFLVAQTA